MLKITICIEETDEGRTPELGTVTRTVLEGLTKAARGTETAPAKEVKVEAQKNEAHSEAAPKKKRGGSKPRVDYDALGIEILDLIQSGNRYKGINYTAMGCTLHGAYQRYLEAVKRNNIENVAIHVSGNRLYLEAQENRA